ncbi:LPXTG cell wall anchor domain-containing protein [Enterococcus sp. OL5]|uniref:LPXTG cell wall anchor domain-containing protein n=1 Tax=Enterococcus sp. OL5 TaxID=2590214 RepID=UPI0016765D3F|nr:LPXTG cell wall anchor domain-containing protein [Enterococcus sp. OL5]
MEKIIKILLATGIGVLILGVEATAYGTQTQSVETQSQIGFTGVYEPIGTPDPTPPENIAHPPIREDMESEGLLPQTNEQNNTIFSVLGLSFLVLFGVLVRKRRN